MKRRQILTGLLAVMLMPSAALAQTAQDQVVQQLQNQGYSRITLGRTLLGRTRIVATGPSGRREIILNPSTGAILRDYLDHTSGRNDDADGYTSDRDEDGDYDNNRDNRDDNDRDDDDNDRDDDDNDDDDDDDHGSGGGDNKGGVDDDDDDD